MDVLSPDALMARWATQPASRAEVSPGQGECIPARWALGGDCWRSRFVPDKNRQRNLVISQSGGRCDSVRAGRALVVKYGSPCGMAMNAYRLALQVLSGSEVDPVHDATRRTPTSSSVCGSWTQQAGSIANGAVMRVTTPSVSHAPRRSPLRLSFVC
jgi:hypothetical protein